MAIGAIFFSVPAAAFVALYLCILHGLGPAEGVALYSVVGALSMLAMTLLPTTHHD